MAGSHWPWSCIWSDPTHPDVDRQAGGTKKIKIDANGPVPGDLGKIIRHRKMLRRLGPIKNEKTRDLL